MWGVDVLMVWHAYMLNPRCFLEDCFRLGLMDFWMTGLPWALIVSKPSSANSPY